ncbi:MAG TPA: (2Fe-2S)-binding protein [Candidatus Obscuribacter sp.]|nr:(2Fe-2S)-binding protein [Candidatus Obscuribacter sp.]HND70040.1 (2Fe-2S)-binding protein [Candidatus Obscuribacter sp.]
MYICSCHAVTDGAIRKAVMEGGIRRFRDLAKSTGVSTNCGICGKHAKEVFDKAMAELPADQREPGDAAVGKTCARPVTLLMEPQCSNCSNCSCRK